MTIKHYFEATLLLLPVLLENFFFVFVFFFSAHPTNKAQEFNEGKQAYKCIFCALDSTIVTQPKKGSSIAVFLQAALCSLLFAGD